MQQHPQRLYFPYQLSRQHWGSAARQRAAALERPLRSPLMAAFATSLNDTTYPGHRLDSWNSTLSPLLAAGNRVRSGLYQPNAHTAACFGPCC